MVAGVLQYLGVHMGDYHDTTTFEDLTLVRAVEAQEM